MCLFLMKNIMLGMVLSSVLIWCRLVSRLVRLVGGGVVSRLCIGVKVWLGDCVSIWGVGGWE